MALPAAEKTAIIEKHQRHPSDSGSSEVQVAILTQRINSLAEHLRANKHDNPTGLEPEPSSRWRRPRVGPSAS